MHQNFEIIANDAGVKKLAAGEFAALLDQRAKLKAIAHGLIVHRTSLRRVAAAYQFLPNRAIWHSTAAARLLSD
jgi:hypothetical protein